MVSLKSQKYLGRVFFKNLNNLFFLTSLQCTISPTRKRQYTCIFVCRIISEAGSVGRIGTDRAHYSCTRFHGIEGQINSPLDGDTPSSAMPAPECLQLTQEGSTQQSRGSTMLVILLRKHEHIQTQANASCMYCSTSIYQTLIITQNACSLSTHNTNAHVQRQVSGLIRA